MAQDVLNGILASHLDNGYPIPEPAYKGGHPVEVSPKVAFAIGLRKARAERSQKEVAAKAGITYHRNASTYGLSSLFRAVKPRGFEIPDVLCRLPVVFDEVHWLPLDLVLAEALVRRSVFPRSRESAMPGTEFRYIVS